MKNIVPCFYSSYGRYINKYRMIPYYIDALQPVVRRCLLGLYETAKDKPTKSAKVVGYIVGNYHPHGDTSCYGTLHQLVINNLAQGEGNWGSCGLTDENPAAMRYTEIKISKFIAELAFPYIKYVPWVNFEYEEEPSYLPSPIPIGLIGSGILNGISFYRTDIPRYKFNDLVKRLVWLLNNLNNYESNENGKNIIFPNIDGCIVKNTQDNINNAFSLLTSGIGKIKFIPNVSIDEKERAVIVKGRAPNKKFTSLLKACDDKNNELYGTRVIDVGGDRNEPYTINVKCIPKKKSTNLQEFAKKILLDHLINDFNFNCYFSDEEGNVSIQSIDQVLINNYYAWMNAVQNYNIDNFNKTTSSKFDYTLISQISQLIKKYNINNEDEIIEKYKTEFSDSSTINIEYYDLERGFYTYQRIIENNDIKNVINRYSIKKLININIDINEIDDKIMKWKKVINNIQQDCFNKLSNYL